MGSKRTTDGIDLGFDPNRIDHNTAFVGKALNFFGERLCNPLTLRASIQSLTGTLEGAPLGLHLSNCLLYTSRCV